MARPKTYIIRYNISPNSAAALRKVDGRAEARIIRIACGPAPEGHSRWTLRLLEEKARVELDTPVGREAIRQTLKILRNLPSNLEITSSSIQKKKRCDFRESGISIIKSTQ